MSPHRRSDMRRSARAQPVARAMAAAVVLVVGASACAGGEASFDGSGRTRPTDTGAHNHSADDSALAPETVRASDIAALGAGPMEGEQMQAWLGVNVCGRFVELPTTDGVGGVSVGDTGLLTISPAPGDETGHDVTVADVLASMDMEAVTGRITFGPSWDPQVVDVAGEAQPLAGTTLSTADLCGDEQGEVQLWYYTPAAVDTGERVRMVVTDPQDVPIVADGSAITIAFAPVSSLPTLPPAALVG